MEILKYLSAPYPNNTPLFSKLEIPNMKFVLVIVAIMSLGGLTACQPSTSGNVVTSSDMGGSNDGSGGGSGY